MRVLFCELVEGASAHDSGEEIGIYKTSSSFTTSRFYMGFNPHIAQAICCDLREAGWQIVGLESRFGQYVLPCSVLRGTNRHMG